MENNNPKQKVIVIGLDGASPEIFFARWKEEFPNINRIKERGFYGRLKSSIPFVTATAWVSFATGCNPGKHGIFEYLYQDKASDELRPVSSRNIRVQTAYEILKDHGLKSILINLPVSYPPKTDDVTLTSLLTRGDEFVFPKKLKDEIPEMKKYRLVPNPEYDVELDRKKFIEDISNLEKDKFEVAKILFKKKWSLFFILFGGTDWIQHKFYYQMVKKSKKKNTVIIDFYKELDSYIGWFLKNKDENTHLFILSDHGFMVYNGVVGLNNLLEQYGYLKFKKSNQEEIIPSRHQREISKTLKQKKALAINPVVGKIITKNKFIVEGVKAIYHLLFQKRIKIYTTPKGKEVDLEHSKAFCRSTESQGIFIKKGHENIKKELMKKLNDEKIFCDVKEKTDIYHGPYTKNAPDIVLKSKKNQITKNQLNPIIKKNTNGHDYDGIFLLDSPYIERNKSINKEITDIAPTILHFLGIDPKKYSMDGKIIVTK